ncbi:hypothetical protein Glove_109g403 [Diversispora epigaea]|uniref:Uncharacterized protein n=1 Tax=Diversispora epigaea TaxID=1348612 RepID=A0A397J758_9GLOM|nr:hypothetical protein Glove_109g403 [Diversispora epigaea]
MKRQISEESEVPQKRIIIKRSKDVQERMNEKKRWVVDKATEILRPLFNSRQNKMTFAIPPPISEVHIKQRRSGEPEVPRKRIIIKRSKDIQKRISEERRRTVKKATEILQPLFNTRQNKVTFAMPPPFSEVLFKQRKGGKGKGVEEDEKIKESKEKVLERVDEILQVTSDGSDGSDGNGGDIASSGLYNFPSNGATSTTATPLNYQTHPQAIYTSQLLNYSNLPKPKNEENFESKLEELTKSFYLINSIKTYSNFIWQTILGTRWISSYFKVAQRFRAILKLYKSCLDTWTKYTIAQWDSENVLKSIYSQVNSIFIPKTLVFTFEKRNRCHIRLRLYLLLESFTQQSVSILMKRLHQ